MVHRLFYILLGISLLTSCADADYFFPDAPFDDMEPYVPTDYSSLDHWAAHPTKDDTADRVPGQTELSDQSQMKADVFFIHPTTLTGHEGEAYWNADVDDAVLNKRTDESTIIFQASIFNAAGKVYAPRYQQAHVQAFYTQDTVSKQKSLELAYQDVKRSFEYYLNNWNNGRPFILASHSQGTIHAKQLIKELIDGQSIQDQLIAAYLVGIVVNKDEFVNIEPCENPTDINCTISWRTFRNDIKEGEYVTSNKVLVTNPLSWKTDKVYTPKEMNKGTILKDIDKVYGELVDAQVDNGILKVSKPSFFGSIFYTTKNYHIPDMNFFYFNTRDNAKERVEMYLQETSLGD